MTTGTLMARIVPPSAMGSRRARHLLERNFLVYRHAWIVIFSGFFEPLFYLFSIGIGLGKLVGDVVGPTGEPISYAAFVAPALLGAAAMNGAVYESTFNIFFKLKYAKIYDAVLATPMAPGDIAIGEITWSLFRGALYATGFLVVMWIMGLMPSLWGLLAVPAALLLGFGFAAAGMAATSFMRSWQDFDLVQLVTLPLFLFSATFYPLSVYPEWLRWAAQLSPLYHGVVLIRSLTLGIFEWTMLYHIGFLVVMGAVGIVVAARRLEKLLLA
ncbi:MAG: ABC transporter permease [Actinobacteria bacterium]|nr:ABC transporter permease [Actinomycetota bacterium]